MYADAVRCTHNGTGGASTITLAAITGYPQPTDVFGTSGTKFISYAISEYTDSTKTVLSKFESGEGLLVLSTNVLTRSLVLKTWTSGGSYGGGTSSPAPTALTFGNTATNIDIILGATTANTIGAIMSTTASVSGFSSDVWMPFNTRQTYDSAMGTFTMTAGSRLYIPTEYRYGRPITQVAIDVATLASTTHIRIGLYDVDPSNGMAGNLITEFTSATQIDSATAGFRSMTMANPFWTPPAIYFQCLQSDGAPVIRRLSHFGHSLLSTASAGGRDILMYDKSATYGALPATGDQTASTTYSRSGGGQCGGLFK